MKPKNFKKKLALNKKTVADFKIGQMEGIHGGFDNPRIPASELQDPCISWECAGTTGGIPCKTC